MHRKLADRAVKILKDKKIREGTPAAEEYIRRLCAGAEPEVWNELREAQKTANGWDMKK